MRESGYYPPGAEFDPNAPYNQPADPDPIDVECEVSVTLSKTLWIDTVNYSTECDEEGYCETTLNDGYLEMIDHLHKQHASISDLLGELAKYIKKELDDGAKGSRKQQLEKMLEDCEGWEVEELDLDDYNC